MLDRIVLRRIAGELLFRDYARPVEWISLLMLAGWLQFLIFHTEDFLTPRFKAFAGLSPGAWAFAIGAILFAQLIAMWPTRRALVIRFVAMACAAGIWTVIAAFFWRADIPTIAARTNSIMALAAAVTAVYLGLRERS